MSLEQAFWWCEMLSGHRKTRHMRPGTALSSRQPALLTSGQRIPIIIMKLGFKMLRKGVWQFDPDAFTCPPVELTFDINMEFFYQGLMSYVGTGQGQEQEGGVIGPRKGAATVPATSWLPIQAWSACMTQHRLAPTIELVPVQVDS